MAWVLVEEPAKALVDLQRAVELTAGNGIYYLYRGSAHLQLGRKKEAERDFSKALELEPTLDRLIQSHRRVAARPKDPPMK